ncbi:amidohydrolase family protein [Sphingomonas sp. MAH-20]|uniref:Amidohydrolase family protein n=1 Tax=Sphingomonas horti TaxID=2682842 RepID=A0A6I4J5P4_9SPHN|nr:MULTISPECIES: amidohydrolase family protein [Sphingomonas]MBA2919531.1 amidohydrolase family protein [Sphingomonas sp. CGMCC 1.13658]MVO78411.1 amidohydrolase family protein [Sphingomonas horti]
MSIRVTRLAAALALLGALSPLRAASRDLNPAPARTEGRGPFTKLVIRGVTLINGTGSPPMGPVDIVIEGNRIADIKIAGTPGLPLKANREPHDATEELDATGMYVLPGFVDMHVHGGDSEKAPNLEYAYKLWLAHGVTTVRGVPLASASVSASEKDRSARNEIAAPRIWNYQTLGSGWGRVDTPEKARAWVRWAAQHNIDGIKFFNTGDETPEIDAAAIDEAKKAGLGTVAHLSQTGVAQLNAVQAGRLGLGTVTHFYGHFESMLKDGRVQSFPSNYNYLNEYDRFGQVAAIVDQSVEPESPEWWDYLEEQKKNGVTFDPTFTIYLASRDLMRARNADWHREYTLPTLWNYYQASRDNHGSYFYDWTTADEVRWRRFYSKFEELIDDYQKIGGRVTTGSDSGFIYQLYGFGYIQELELMQEAGLTPLEVIQAATINGARTLNEPKGTTPQFGIVRPGMLADLVIVPENPLANFKVLYGTGRLRLNPTTGVQERAGGVRWTIKDGIIYDAPALLAEVRAMVARSKAENGVTVEP